MARPRIFEPGDRAGMHLYMREEQQAFLKMYAAQRGVSPSHVVRELVQSLMNQQRLKARLAPVFDVAFPNP